MPRLFLLLRVAARRMACAAGALVLLAFGSGCGGDAPADPAKDAPFHEAPGAAFQQAAGTRAQALGALDSLRQGAWRSAFEQLGRLGYRRRVRTEQRTPDGSRVVAFEERTVRFAPGTSEAARVLRSDSAGTFDFGTLGRFVSARAGDSPPQDLAQQILADEPSFLSQRNRHAFRYRLLPDTTLPGGVGRVRVVAVRARPGPSGQKQTVRRARLYLEAGTGQLAALRLHRRRQTMLFDEDTRQFVRLRRVAAADTSAWVPAQTRFATRLDMPMRSPRHFRSAASYSQYRTASS